MNELAGRGSRTIMLSVLAVARFVTPRFAIIWRVLLQEVVDEKQ